MRIITDTSSDITLTEAQDLGIDLVKIAITFEDGEAPQGHLEDFETFYQLLEQAKELPKTSQPSPKEYLDILKDAQNKNEEVLIITLSSGLSSTYNTVCILVESLDKPELVRVIDSKQAIMTQRLLVNKAVELRAQGKSLHEMVDELTVFRDKLHLFGCIDSLVYLKKGGRIPASLAAIGTVLKVKPIIEIKDTVLSNLGTVRGTKAAKKHLWTKLDDLDVDLSYGVLMGYTGGLQEKEALKTYIEDTKTRYKLDEIKLYPVGGVIGTHLGPGSIIFAVVTK
ncbi:MAG TPA: DegV family protein [Erysipelothrix sp.]|nr:DegV family protein [Erysipelothrix sp.]